jgi:hypothetical protein
LALPATKEPAMAFMKTTLSALCIAALFGTGAALMQPAQAQAPKKAMTAEEKRAKSKECSALADQQGLRGKKRRAFRSKCRRGRV